MAKYVWIFNANNGCISWREIPSSQTEQEVLENLKSTFSSDEFTFEIKDAEPKIPQFGYTSDEKEHRRIRFVKNIT